MESSIILLWKKIFSGEIVRMRREKEIFLGDDFLHLKIILFNPLPERYHLYHF